MARPAHADDAAAAYADDLARVVPAARSRTDLQQPDAEPAGRIPQGCAFPVPVRPVPGRDRRIRRTDAENEGTDRTAV